MRSRAGRRVDQTVVNSGNVAAVTGDGVQCDQVPSADELRLN